MKDRTIYFSLKEIAPSSPYSSDYLRIRILQKKLRGIKVGREWYTTREWLTEYSHRYALKSFASLEDASGVEPEPEAVGPPAAPNFFPNPLPSDVPAPAPAPLLPLEILAAKSLDAIPVHSPLEPLPFPREDILRRHDFREFVSGLRNHFPKKLLFAPLAAGLLFLVLSPVGAAVFPWRDAVASRVAQRVALLSEGVGSFFLEADVPNLAAFRYSLDDFLGGHMPDLSPLRSSFSFWGAWPDALVEKLVATDFGALSRVSYSHMFPWGERAGVAALPALPIGFLPPPEDDAPFVESQQPALPATGADIAVRFQPEAPFGSGFAVFPLPAETPVPVPRRGKLLAVDIMSHWDVLRSTSLRVARGLLRPSPQPLPAGSHRTEQPLLVPTLSEVVGILGSLPEQTYRSLSILAQGLGAFVLEVQLPEPSTIGRSVAAYINVGVRAATGELSRLRGAAARAPERISTFSRGSLDRLRGMGGVVAVRLGELGRLSADFPERLRGQADRALAHIAGADIFSAVREFIARLPRPKLPERIARFFNLSSPPLTAPQANAPVRYALEPRKGPPVAPPPLETTGGAAPVPAPPLRVREVIEAREVVRPADVSLFQAKLDQLNAGLRTTVNKLVADVAGLYEGSEIKTSVVRAFSPSQSINELFDLKVDSGLTVRSGNLTVSAGDITVTGNSRVTGTFTTDGAFAAASLSTGGLISSTGSGTSTFSGGVSTAGLASSNGLRVSAGDTILAGGLAVTGSSNLTGSVGIGTSTPSHLLTVRGPFLANGTSTIEGGGLITQGLFSTTSLNFYTASNAAPRLTIDSSGNVGIGTTSPGTLFAVNGPGLFVGTSTIFGGLNLESVSATGTLGFYTRGTAGPRMIIDSSGNVGIATSGPTTTFSTVGSGYFTAGLGAGYATTGAGNIVANDFILSRGRLGVNATGSPTVEFGVIGSGYLTGGFGIGEATTSPGGLLVKGQGVFDQTLNIRGTGTSTFSGGLSAVGLRSTSGIESTAGDFLLTGGKIVSTGSGTSTFSGGGSFAGLASSAGLRVSAGDSVLAGGLAVTGSSNLTGSVGIGTSTPSHLLTVRGPFLANGTSTIEGGGLITQGLFSTTSLAFYTNSNVAARLFIEGGGNIGVGTTGPQANLAVTTTAGAMPFLVGSSTGSYIVVDEFGGVGVGGRVPDRLTMFGVQYEESATNTARILIGGNVKIGTNAVNNVFRLMTNGNIFIDGAISSPADYAELLETRDTDLVPGELVSIDLERPNHVRRATTTADSHLMGVVSTKPGIVGVRASDVTEAADARAGDEQWKQVAFLGQVPTRVTGMVAIGDHITSSDIPGVGRRAEAGEPTVCITLESHTGGDIGSVNCLLSRNNRGYARLDAGIGAMASGGGLWTVEETTGRIKTIYPLDLSGNDILNVKSVLSQNGAWSIDDTGKLVASEITAREKLQVGSAESPRGITLFDFDTGQPNCVFVQSGALRSVPGECTFTSSVEASAVPPSTPSTSSGQGSSGQAPPAEGSSGDGETAAAAEALAPTGDASPDTATGAEIVVDTTSEAVTILEDNVSAPASTSEPAVSDAGEPDAELLEEALPFSEASPSTSLGASGTTATSSTP